MKIAILVSSKDTAGMNMKKALLDTKLFEKSSVQPEEPFDSDAVYVFTKNRNHILYTLSCDSIHAEEIDKKIDADFFLFLTRHQGGSGIPSLSAHCIGNFGDAEYGGRPGTLVPAPADYIAHALELMEKHKGTLQYEIVQEATHHGPYLEKPTMFIEIGSSEKEWKDEQAVAVQAKVILEFLTTTPPYRETAIGFGGQHTTPSFRKVALKANLAFGHIAAKYAVPAVTQGLIDEMIEKTIIAAQTSQASAEGKKPIIILDWKGLGSGKQHLLDLLAKSGHSYKRTDEF